MTEHFFRHGNELTAVTIVDDPVYLEEPFIRSTNFILNPGQEVGRTQFDIVDEVAGRPKDYVPHYLPGSPGALSKLTEYASEHRIPPDATRGGAVTTYPEYQVAPRACGRPRSAGPACAVRTTRVTAAIRTSKTDSVTHVLDKGHLVEEGTHDALLRRPDGVYARLWSMQAGATGLSDKVVAALRQLTDKPIRIVINTHVHPDHVGGNEPIAQIGQWFGGNAPGNFGLPQEGARVIAHEQLSPA
jgi:hypothetical protein